MLLVGVAQSHLSLFGGWSGDLAVLAFIGFFMLELRHVVRRRPTLYALAAITGVTVVVALVMADAEQDYPESKIRSGGQALFWVASQIFRFGTLTEVKPVSASGNILGIVAIISGVLFAAFLFSAVTAWAVGVSAHDADRSIDSTVREAVREALIEAGVIPRQAEEVRQMQRLVIDVDRVVGHEPRTWWADRGQAIERYVRDAPDDERILHAAQAVGCRPALLVSRLSGAWADREDPGEAMGASLDLIVIDVSFISLTLILPAAFGVLKPSGDLICLIKPQFELRREQIGKGGIVREPAFREEAVTKIRQFATGALAKDWRGLVESPISGTDGNVEYLAWLRHLPPESD